METSVFGAPRNGNIVHGCPPLPRSLAHFSDTKSIVQLPFNAVSGENDSSIDFLTCTPVYERFDGDNSLQQIRADRPQDVQTRLEFTKNIWFMLNQGSNQIKVMTARSKQTLHIYFMVRIVAKYGSIGIVLVDAISSLPNWLLINQRQRYTNCPCHIDVHSGVTVIEMSHVNLWANIFAYRPILLGNMSFLGHHSTTSINHDADATVVSTEIELNRSQPLLMNLHVPKFTKLKHL